MEVLYSSKFSEDSKSICIALLNKSGSERLGCSAGRNGALEVKRHPWFTSINWNRLEVGMEKPDFVPDPRAVYAKSAADIEQFSEVKGVKFDATDEEVYKTFNTGAVPAKWQEEMIETGVFDELNQFGPEDTVPPDLDFDLPPTEEPFCSRCQLL